MEHYGAGAMRTTAKHGELQSSLLAPGRDGSRVGVSGARKNQASVAEKVSAAWWGRKTRRT